MADRFLELKQIAQIRKLDPDEQFEFDALQRARNAAAQDPVLRHAKAEAARQADEHARRAAAANSYAIWQTLCNTPVDGKYLVDNEANFRIVASWQHPGEIIQNYPEWLVRILKEMPSLKTQVGWYTRPTPAQQVLQRKEDQKRLREQFELACKTHGLALNEANFNIWRSVPDGVISVFNGSPCILNEDGSTVDLIPASQEQIDQWASDARQKVVDQHQAKLKDMAARNDLAGLRAEAAREYAEKHSPQTLADVQQERVYKELRSQYEKDSQAGFWEPLPAVFTKKQIYTWNAAEMRKQMSRYGASRITARIHGLTEMPDGNGGTINFEEKRQ